MKVYTITKNTIRKNTITHIFNSCQCFYVSRLGTSASHQDARLIRLQGDHLGNSFDVRPGIIEYDCTAEMLQLMLLHKSSPQP